MTSHHRDASRDLGDVSAAYDRAAATYDKMVNLRPGYHRNLQSAADALVEKLPAGRGLTVLDLGCGSGASTDALVNSMGHRGEPFAAVGVDISTGMLAEAQSKPWPTWVTFVEARAESLLALRQAVSQFAHETSAPDGYAGASGVAGVLATHLFCSLRDRATALRTVWEVLDPGGVLVVQEYSVADSAPARVRWNAMTWSMIIPVAKVIHGDTGVCRDQWRSVLDNDAVDVFAHRMLDAGFVDVEHRTAGGWHHGMLHTFRGRKPV